MEERQLIQEKLTQAAEILNEQDLDVWLTFVRETAMQPDPALELIYGSDMTWQSAFLLTKSGERIAIVGHFDSANLYELDVYTQIIGYQVCTLYRDGAHLARLAVHPGYQGRGIGSVLLNDVLRRFFKRRVYTMTVNTQVSNHRSQHLYQRYGFERNGYDLPVWSIRL